MDEKKIEPKRYNVAMFEIKLKELKHGFEESANEGSSIFDEVREGKQ